MQTKIFEVDEPTKTSFFKKKVDSSFFLTNIPNQLIHPSFMSKIKRGHVSKN